jgi:hypothetical protein
VGSKDAYAHPETDGTLGEADSRWGGGHRYEFRRAAAEGIGEIPSVWSSLDDILLLDDPQYSAPLHDHSLKLEVVGIDGFMMNARFINLVKNTERN